MPRASDDAGQASVEFVVLLPLLVMVAAALWQAVLAGQAVWASANAARAAARAEAVGGDPAPDAGGALPASPGRALHVDARRTGVRVDVPLPLVLTGDHLAPAGARGAPPPQR